MESQATRPVERRSGLGRKKISLGLSFWRNTAPRRCRRPWGGRVLGLGTARATNAPQVQPSRSKPKGLALRTHPVGRARTTPLATGLNRPRAPRPRPSGQPGTTSGGDELYPSHAAGCRCGPPPGALPASPSRPVPPPPRAQAKPSPKTAGEDDWEECESVEPDPAPPRGQPQRPAGPNPGHACNGLATDEYPTNLPEPPPYRASTLPERIGRSFSRFWAMLYGCCRAIAPKINLGIGINLFRFN